jgi:peroxiredoxin
VGFDAPSKMQTWAEEEGFQYDVWTDGDRTLAVTYGAASSTSSNYADRITVLLDANGDLLLEYVEDVVVGTHPAQVLEDCQILIGGR